MSTQEELEMMSYNRDELRHTLEKIMDLFDIHYDGDFSLYDGMCDEHFGDWILGKLRGRVIYVP